MGRTERELDPSSGPVQRFAYDLRLLRIEAGSPSYRELSQRAQYAPSVLSRAASGRDLPSLNVTLAYVAACDGDIEAWRERWTALTAGQRGADTAGTSQPGNEDVPEPARRPRRLLERLLVAGVSAALGAICVAATVTMSAPGKPSASIPAAATGSSASAVRPQDGVDPKVAGCAGDAKTIATVDIRLSRTATTGGMVLPAGMVIGTVELRYSRHCRAGWSRVTPAAALSQVRTATVQALISRASDKFSASYAGEKITVFYTDVLLMSGSCLRASGTIVIGEARGSAQTGCQATS